MTMRDANVQLLVEKLLELSQNNRADAHRTGVVGAYRKGKADAYESAADLLQEVIGTTRSATEPLGRKVR